MTKGLQTTKSLVTKHFPLLILFFIVLLGASLRLYSLGSKNLWYDEISCANIAGRSIEDQVIYTLYTPRSVHLHPPLYTILLHFSLYLGNNEFAARLPSAIFGTLSIFILFKLGKSLFGTREGLISAFLLSISTMNIWFSREAVMYSQFTFFALLSIFFFCRAIRKNDTESWIGFIISTALGIYTHFYMMYVVLIQIPFFLHFLYEKRNVRILRLPKIEKKKTYALIATLAIASIVLVPVAQMAFMVIKQGSLGRYYGIPPDVLVQALFSEFSGDYRETLYPVPILLVLPFFLVGLIASIKSRSRSAALVALWVLLPIAVVFVLSFVFGSGAYVTTRQMMFILPGYLLGVSKGISSLVNYLLDRSSHATANLSEKKRIAVSLLLAIVLFGSISADSLNRYYGEENTDWRSVAEYLRTNAKPGEIVIVTNYYDSVACFSYYYQEEGNNVTTVFPPAEKLFSGNLSSIDSGIWFITPDPPTISRDRTENKNYYENLKNWVVKNEFGVVERFFRVVILYRPNPPHN